MSSSTHCQPIYFINYCIKEGCVTKIDLPRVDHFGGDEEDTNRAAPDAPFRPTLASYCSEPSTHNLASPSPASVDLPDLWMDVGLGANSDDEVPSTQSTPRSSSSVPALSRLSRRKVCRGVASAGHEARAKEDRNMKAQEHVTDIGLSKDNLDGHPHLWRRTSATSAFEWSWYLVSGSKAIESPPLFVSDSPVQPGDTFVYCLTTEPPTFHYWVCHALAAGAPRWVKTSLGSPWPEKIARKGNKKRILYRRTLVKKA
ncbi:hypothetical protein HGRIS_012234 [Hohenbuehelia grisea]|uniref:Uncharacterized protein n=1 Tax=Hohenbuehelia grisea TaxID=104357 RepID=A0ABR3IRT6_9AGAR